MKLGDLVMYGEGFWLVTRYDPKRTRTATLLAARGGSVEVPVEDPTVTVVANPAADWPFVAAPVKPVWGPVTQLVMPGIGRPEPTQLALYRDWLPSEPARAGGSIFLNPALGLQPGDYLLATHRNGRGSRLVIPAHFATVRQKQTRAAAKPKPDRTAYTRLLGEDPFGEDD
jgi:hypothetical protein